MTTLDMDTGGGDEPLPLSEHEQRILHELEQSLYQEDPDFAERVRSETVYRHAGRYCIWSALVFVAALVFMFFTFSRVGGPRLRRGRGDVPLRRGLRQQRPADGKGRHRRHLPVAAQPQPGQHRPRSTRLDPWPLPPRRLTAPGDRVRRGPRPDRGDQGGRARSTGGPWSWPSTSAGPRWPPPWSTAGGSIVVADRVAHARLRPGRGGLRRAGRRSSTGSRSLTDGGPVSAASVAVGRCSADGETVSPLNIRAWRRLPAARSVGRRDLVGCRSRSTTTPRRWPSARDGWGRPGGGRLSRHGRVDRHRRRHRPRRPAARRRRTATPATSATWWSSRTDGLCPCGGRGCLEAEASGLSIEAITGRPAAEAPDRCVVAPERWSAGRWPRWPTCWTCELAVVAGSVALGFGAAFFDAAQEEIELRARLDFSRWHPDHPGRAGRRRAPGRGRRGRPPGDGDRGGGPGHGRRRRVPIGAPAHRMVPWTSQPPWPGRGGAAAPGSVVGGPRRAPPAGRARLVAAGRRTCPSRPPAVGLPDGHRLRKA